MIFEKEVRAFYPLPFDKEQDPREFRRHEFIRGDNIEQNHA
jgi:hypothetical protein